MTTFILQGARAAVPYLVNTAGRVALTYASSAINNALNPQTLSGPRLESLHIQTSRDGAPMPRVFGRTRLAGQVIWASNFKETSETTRSGGKGGGPKITNYSYTVSFAVGLCQGEITSVERLWANGENLKKSGINYRVHTGSEAQNPDPIITLIDGPNAPAFRGTAYIVFEDFPLDDFGARLPQINAEIIRAPKRISIEPRLEDLIKGVDLIPGSGEFVYGPEAIEDSSEPGRGYTINVNNLTGQTDVNVALDQLQATLPNCRSVNIVASWFGDDLNCGDCRIMPGVETRTRRTKPDDWRVGNASRSNAYLISRIEDKPVYGGTPSDKNLIALIREIKSRGLKASFYPFVLMDIQSGSGQPEFPWRGRISSNPSGSDQTASAAAQVNSFFGNCEPGSFSYSDNRVDYSGPDENSFRRMILHYAALCAGAGGVDSFVIGSEMRGLTTVRGPGLSYPAVAQFKRLAADVRGLVGTQTKLTYAADWSEYFGHHTDGNAVFHLDPLWSDPNIDAIGIDAYFPLSDARSGDAEIANFTAAVEGEEGYDWYYKTPSDRDAQIRTPITDGAYNKPWVFRYKDIRNWWSNPHYNRIGNIEQSAPTGWAPQSKPVWLTEVGCPAVDKGASQPNVFFDPKSSESALPYFSSGNRNDLEQRRYLETLIGYWQPAAGNNPVSEAYGGPMIDPDYIHVWCWDARPFPDFPARTDIWSDGPNWSRGHWITGRVGASLLADVVHEIASEGGAANIDVSRLTGLVSGFTLDRPMSPRAALEPLAQTYGFTCIEVPDGLRFQMLGSGAATDLDVGDIAVSAQSSAEPALTLRRTDSAQAPQDVRLHFIDIGNDYQRGMASAQDRLATRDFVTDIEAPLVLDRGLADIMAQTLLARSLSANHSLRFDVMPSAAALLPGDIIRLPETSDAPTQAYVIEGLDGLSTRSVTAQPVFDGGPGVLNTAQPQILPPVITAAEPQFVVLDMVHITASETRAGPLVAAYSAPWSEVTATQGRSDSVTLETPARLGVLLTDLPRGPVGRFHAHGEMRISAASADLSSATRADMLAGDNALALKTSAGWEVLQYQNAQLIGPSEYRLSGLLRGQAGSDAVMDDVTAAGAQIVLLGQGIYTLPADAALRDTDIDIEVSARVRDDSQTYAHEYRAVHLKPLAPVHARVETLPDGGARLSWIRRTRLGGDDWAAADVPLGEDEERYAVKILSGGEVIADYEVTQPELVLSAENMPPGQTPSVRIYQLSRMAGRGYPLQLSL